MNFWLPICVVRLAVSTCIKRKHIQVRYEVRKFCCTHCFAFRFFFVNIPLSSGKEWKLVRGSVLVIVGKKLNVRRNENKTHKHLAEDKVVVIFYIMKGWPHLRYKHTDYSLCLSFVCVTLNFYWNCTKIVYLLCCTSVFSRNLEYCTRQQGKRKKSRFRFCKNIEMYV